MDTNVLPDDKRTQLDGIVQQMTQNQEPDANIQAVVDDFKSKYSAPPQETASSIWDAAKGVGNFLFPIVGDAYNDIAGKNDKTVLQQAGDLGLSALPFVPGLGEAGEAARAGEAGLEGAGLLSKIAASTAARGAATGYGAGVAANLSQGKGIGEAFVPNANTIMGAGLGAFAPAAMSAAGKLTNKISGISEQTANDLADRGINVGDYNTYMNAAKARNLTVRAASPLQLAADKLDEAAAQVTTNRKVAGAAVGALKGQIGANPIGDITDIIENFAKHVDEKFGLKITPQGDGTLGVETKPGSFRQTPPAVQSRISNIANQLNALRTGTVGQASDVAANLNDLIDRSKADIYGHTNDPLEALIKNTDGAIRAKINNSSPELAQANANFSGLKDLEEGIKDMVGKKLQRGELLMKRVFSGDKSGDVQDLFGKIKAVTGIDLVNHAVLAKHAIDTVGDASQRSLLDQAIEGGIQAHTGGILPAILGVGKSVVQKVAANPERVGRNIVKGKTSIIPSLITKGAIEAGAQPNYR